MAETYTGGVTIGGAYLPDGEYTLEQAAAVLNADPRKQGTFTALDGQLHLVLFGNVSSLVVTVNAGADVSSLMAATVARTQTDGGEHG